MKKYISINTSKRQQKALTAAIVSMFLSACGGGGGGTVPTTSTPTPTTPATPAATPFTSWSAVTNGSTVMVPGMSQEASWTNVPVSSITPTPAGVDTAASSFTETLNSSGAITKVVIASPTGSVTFDTAAGATIVPIAIDPTTTIDLAKNNSAGTIAVAADPIAQGWNYQSFGMWETGGLTTSGYVGVMSVGAPTAGTAIPATGTATFTGKSIGFYTDATGVGHGALSDVSVNADFGARTLALSSSGTVTIDNYVTNATTSPAPNLNLTGTLSYAAGTNSFAGNLTTSGGTPLTGTSTGRFYGPSAQELGGVFILKAGSGVETYGGAYGAKRP